jgi:hypothetical protein
MSDELKEFLKANPDCELCWSCGEDITAATVALPRADAGDEATTPWTLQARVPLCEGCARLLTLARKDGKPLRLWGTTVHGKPVSLAQWNRGRERKRKR